MRRRVVGDVLREGVRVLIGEDFGCFDAFIPAAAQLDDIDLAHFA